MPSNWQCMDIDSQAKAAIANQMFLKDRTPFIDAGKAKYVQSNPFKSFNQMAAHASLMDCSDS
jgi:hypothetical protein